MIQSATHGAVADALDEPRAVRHTARISWAAIFAGVTIAIAIEVLLGILGAGIGLSMVDPVQGSTPSAGGFGIGAGIWWVLTTVIALAAGSYAAARIAGLEDRFDGIIHGLVIWGLTFLLTLYLLTSAIGGIMGGAFRAVGGVASAASSGVSAAAPTVAHAAGIDSVDVETQAAAYFGSSPTDPAAMTPQEAQKEVAKQLPDLAKGGRDGQIAENRIVDVVAAQSKVERPEAQRRVTDAKARFVKAKDNAIDTAKSAADAGAGAAAGTSFAVFFVLLLGAAAAGFGGAAATRRSIFRRHHS